MQFEQHSVHDNGLYLTRVLISCHNSQGACTAARSSTSSSTNSMVSIWPHSTVVANFNGFDLVYTETRRVRCINIDCAVGPPSKLVIQAVNTSILG